MTALAFSRIQAAESASLSKDEIDRAIRRGDLRAKRSGRRVLILASDLDAFLEGLPAA